MASQFGTRIKHAGINVPDMEASVRWYCEVLGFEFVWQNTYQDMKGMIPPCTMIRLNDFYMEVFELVNARPFSTYGMEAYTGCQHLCFETDDYEGMSAYLKSREDTEVVLELRWPTEVSGTVSSGSEIWVRDNSGILVEIAEKIEYPEPEAERRI